MEPISKYIIVIFYRGRMEEGKKGEGRKGLSINSAEFSFRG